MAVPLDRLIPFGYFQDSSPAFHDFDAAGPLSVRGINPRARSSVMLVLTHGAALRGYETYYFGQWTRVNEAKRLAANGAHASVSPSEAADLVRQAFTLFAERREQFAAEGWDSFLDAPEEQRPEPVVFIVDGSFGFASSEPLESVDEALYLRGHAYTVGAARELLRFGAAYRVYAATSSGMSDPSDEPDGASLVLTERGHADYSDGRGFRSRVELWERD